MPAPSDKPVLTGSGGGVFATTHWSLVLVAGDAKSPRAAEALEALCRRYWYPLYVYVRRKGYASEDAQDLTQEFFAQLITKDYLSVADRNRGRFRSFLLGSLEHFLAREWTKARAQKRGGGRTFVSLDELDAENRYLREPAHELTAQKMFDRRWATTLLEQALSRLRDECMANGKGDLFAVVETLLSGEKNDTSYAAFAASLQMSEGAIKVAVHRLRQRYGELVRAEIAETVANPDESKEELRYLLTVLRG
ncbi:MAG: sigma-70 family RNA polymerase sigma factor [Verrucomicrobiota bacterium]